MTKRGLPYGEPPRHRVSEMKNSWLIQEYYFASECFGPYRFDVRRGRILDYDRPHSHKDDRGALWCHDVQEASVPGWLICCGIFIPAIGTVIRLMEDSCKSARNMGKKYVVMEWAPGHTSHQIRACGENGMRNLPLGHDGENDQLHFEVVGTLEDLIK